MTAKKKVLITGASGLIGGLIRKNLGHKYDFSALNRSKVEGIPCTQVDVSDFDAIQPRSRGSIPSFTWRRLQVTYTSGKAR